MAAAWRIECRAKGGSKETSCEGIVIVQMRSHGGWDQNVNEEVSASSGKKWSDLNIKDTDLLTDGLGDRETEQSGKNPRLVGQVEERSYHLLWGRSGKFWRKKLLGGLEATQGEEKQRSKATPCITLSGWENETEPANEISDSKVRKQWES